MIYKIIFTDENFDDSYTLSSGINGSVLILDENGNYFCPYFLSLERVLGEFGKNDSCYFQENLVILHEVTKESILNSIPALHREAFLKSWVPAALARLNEYYYSPDKWVYFEVTCE